MSDQSVDLYRLTGEVNFGEAERIVGRVKYFSAAYLPKRKFLKFIWAGLKLITSMDREKVQWVSVYAASKGYSFEIDKARMILWCNPPASRTNP